VESSATTAVLCASNQSPPRRAQMRTSHSGQPWIRTATLTWWNDCPK